MSSTSLDLVVELLGVERGVAQQLLDQVDGVVESAVAVHFAGAGPSASAGRHSTLQQLRGVVGPEGTDAQLLQLLAQNGNSAARAVEAFLNDGLPRQPAMRARTAGASAADTTPQEVIRIGAPPPAIERWGTRGMPPTALPMPPSRPSAIGAHLRVRQAPRLMLAPGSRRRRRRRRPSGSSHPQDSVLQGTQQQSSSRRLPHPRGHRWTSRGGSRRRGVARRTDGERRHPLSPGKLAAGGRGADRGAAGRAAAK